MLGFLIHFLLMSLTKIYHYSLRHCFIRQTLPCFSTEILGSSINMTLLNHEKLIFNECASWTFKLNELSQKGQQRWLGWTLGLSHDAAVHWPTWMSVFNQPLVALVTVTDTSRQVATMRPRFLHTAPSWITTPVDPWCHLNRYPDQLYLCGGGVEWYHFAPLIL